MDVSGVLFSCLIGLLFTLLYKLYLFIGTIRQAYRLFKDAPGPKSFSWIYGSLHLVKDLNPEQRIDFFEDLNKKYPKYFIFWFGPFEPRVFLNHPDSIKVLLKSSEPKPSAPGSGYRELLPWLGEGLLVANGNRWTRSRRLLTPAFHFDILKPYIRVYNDSAEQLIEQVSKYSDTGASFELFQVISSCTLDIILRCAFSYNSGCQQPGKTHPYLTAVKELTRIVDERTRSLLMVNDVTFYLTSKGQQFRKHCKYVHGVSEEIIDKRRKEMNEKGVPTTRYLDFLDILLTAKDNDGVGLTNLEIRNEVDTFLFEGHDTTSSGLSWILYHLAKHPEHQQKCQDEIDEVLKNRDNDRIEWDDLIKLEYLSMCIKEGMRLSAPVPGISRQLSQEVEIDGKRLPVGTVIIPFLHLLHVNPSVWKDPAKFDPYRFTKENVQNMNPFAYCPFSAGPRNCIGQVFAQNEEKVILARILRRFKLELDLDHSIIREFALVSRSENGIKIRIKERRE